MKSRAILALVLVVASTTVAYGHDLFIKLDSYFVEPHSTVTIPIITGVFNKSENAIMADRLQDISVVSTAGRMQIDTVQWAGDTTLADTTYLTIETQEPGTYVVGASTLARNLPLSGADFNDYLEHDGIPDVLQARRENDELDKDVVERYEKHPKAVFQVGDTPDSPKSWWQFWKDDAELAYLTELGYPAEMVPVVNPYLLQVGDSILVRCLVDGQPVANQYVRNGGEGMSGIKFPTRYARSDADGVAAFVLNSPGKYYLEFIHMIPSPLEGIDYHSKWATLTFAVR
jgi:uncharacterized GH25 family protein